MTVIDRGRELITVGSVSRDEAASRFPFLAERARGRRTGAQGVHPPRSGARVLDLARGRAPRRRPRPPENPPPGRADIFDDEPDYGGFLRGRIARLGDAQLIAIYCRHEALAGNGPAVRQLLAGLAQAPIALEHDALVVSDNDDLYGTLADLHQRAGGERPS